MFRSQAEIKTDNPIWNSSSSCNECGETFASKSKPRIPAEVPLKLKKGGVFRLHVFNLVAQLTLSWLDRMWPEEPVLCLKLLPHRKQGKRQKQKWRRIFGRSANSQTVGNTQLKSIPWESLSRAFQIYRVYRGGHSGPPWHL